MDAEGRFLSHAVSAGRVTGGQPRRRRRREVGVGNDEWEEPRDEPVAHRERLYYNVTIFGREFHLRLRHNARLVAPGAKMEWRDDSDSTRHSEALRDECLYVGDITDTPGATVAISNCDGLVSRHPALPALCFFICLTAAGFAELAVKVSVDKMTRGGTGDRVMHF